MNYFHAGREAVLVKLGFAGLSPRNARHLTNAGIGAAGGALLAGENNRMSGAMGGAALGLSAGHATQANAGRVPMRPRSAGRAVAKTPAAEAAQAVAENPAARTAPVKPVPNRSSGEHQPGGMKPIQKKEFHPAEAGASTPPPGFASNSLPPEAMLSMPPSTHARGQSLPPSATVEIPESLSLRSEAPSGMRPISREARGGELPSMGPARPLSAAPDPFAGMLTIPPPPRMPTSLGPVPMDTWPPSRAFSG